MTGSRTSAVPVVAAALLTVLVTTTASAQVDAVVRGTVVAAADRSALPGATVTLTSEASGDVLTTTADSEGGFAFQSVRPGAYTLAGTLDQFGRRELRIVLEPREVRALSVALDIRRLQVDVGVTVPIIQLPSTHSPSSTVLTADRLDDIPAGSRTNLPEAIVAAAPGMIRGHDDFVHVRGHEVALNPLINGVSFWENPHSVFSGGLSPDVIETANVMTGGFAAEYGNRFGVVDIVTRSGLTMRHQGSVAATVGEARRNMLSGDVGGQRGRLGYFAFGSIFESNRFLSPPDAEAIHDSARGGHLFVQLDRSMGTAGSLRGVIMGDGANIEVPKTPLDEELRPAANATESVRQQSAILGWTRPLSSELLLETSFYQRWSRSHLMPGTCPLTALADVDRELWTVGGKADVTRFSGRHTVKAGLDGVWLRPDEQLKYDYAGYRALSHLLELPHVHITNNTIDFSNRRSGGQVSLYVQDNIQLTDRLTADLGVRADYYTLVASASHASPRVNLAYRVGEETVVHASYNHFFVPPPIEGVLSSSAGLTSRLGEIGVPLPALEPTVENQVEVGVTAPVNVVRLSMTGYYRGTDNPVHTTVWPDSRIYSYASFDRARAYGLETKAELSILAQYGMNGYFNYALGRVGFYNPVTGGFVTEAEHLEESNRFLAPMDQTHTLTAGLTYRHQPSGLRLGTCWSTGAAHHSVMAARTNTRPTRPTTPTRWGWMQQASGCPVTSRQISLRAST
jgi:hypothetical protein